MVGVKDLAEYFGPVQTINHWRLSGRAPRALKIGKHLRFAVGDVQERLDDQHEPVRHLIKLPCVAEISRFRYTFAMIARALARDELWAIATAQHGFVTAQQAADLGITKGALQMMVRRGTLDRAAFGVYRFPQYPVGEHDRLALAVLWTRAPEAVLSHETALDAYGISDINPNRIHVTVGRQRRLRRAGGDEYVVHYENLDARRIGWWQEIPTVTAKTAIEQCLTYGTPTYLLRQAIERGHAQGYLKATERDQLTAALRLVMSDEQHSSRLAALLRTLKPKSKESDDYIAG